MNKKEYLQVLKEALAETNKEMIDEIIEDYEEHFIVGLEKGKTEEEICEALGPISELAEEIKEIYQSDKTMVLEKETKQEILILEEKKDTSERVNEISHLKIDGIFADIVVERSHDGLVHLNCVNEGSERQKRAYQFYHYQEGDTLYAGIRKLENINFLFSLRISSITIYIKLPDNHFHTFINTVSGDVSVEGVNSEDITIVSTSGDINLKNIEVGFAKCNSISGDLSIKRLQAKTVNFKSTSGDISLENAKVEKLKASSSSGDILVRGVIKEAELDSKSGDVSAHLSEEIRLKAGSISGDISVSLGNSNGYSMDVKTVSGDVSIDYDNVIHHRYLKTGNYSYGKQGSTLKLSTVSGDIQLTN